MHISVLLPRASVMATASEGLKGRKWKQKGASRSDSPKVARLKKKVLPWNTECLNVQSRGALNLLVYFTLHCYTCVCLCV